MESHLALARRIACPVALISSAYANAKKSGETNDNYSDFCDFYDFYMISSISYVNLDPLILSTTFLKTSKTGTAALASKQMAVSLLGFQHLDSVMKLESQPPSEKDPSKAASTLSKIGFNNGRLQSGLLYVKDSLLSLGLQIFSQSELDQYIVVMATIEEIAPTETTSDEQKGTTKREPLIRYNRLYATIDQERLSQGNDRYPV